MNQQTQQNHKWELPTWISSTWIIVALIGFIDATYLTIQHFQGQDVACSLVHGCNVVLTSSYSMIGSVPVALLGAGYYLVMLLGMVLYVDRKHIRVAASLGIISITGVLASAWFVYVQAVLLKSFCQYCLLSALTSTLLFILGMILLKKIKKYGSN